MTTQEISPPPTDEGLTKPQSHGQDNALEWALSMAAIGYAVVPTRVRLVRKSTGELKKDMRGQGDGWQTTAVLSAAVIRAWWERVGATGYLVACGPSGITVADLDVTNVDGMVAWSALGGPRSTFVVRTPSGGEHHYFAGRGMGNGALAYIDQQGSKVNFGDLRGVGGGVYGPGSVLLGEDNATPVGTWTAVTA